MSFSRLKRITTWVYRFFGNCHRPKADPPTSLYLSSEELSASEVYWMSLAQHEVLASEIETLRSGQSLKKTSCLFSLHPFVDSSGLFCVGDRGQNLPMSFSVKHPVILPGKHAVTSLLITSEHLRLMHAGPTLLAASLSRRYHITSCCKIVRSAVHNCITCRHSTNNQDLNFRDKFLLNA